MVKVNDRVRQSNSDLYKGTILHIVTVQEDEEGNGEITYCFVLWDDGIATAHRSTDLRVLG